MWKRKLLFKRKWRIIENYFFSEKLSPTEPREAKDLRTSVKKNISPGIYQNPLIQAGIRNVNGDNKSPYIFDTDQWNSLHYATALELAHFPCWDQTTRYVFF